jgi:hypothetical protein
MHASILPSRALSGLVLALALGGCEGESRTEHIQIPGDLERLEIDNGAGDVAVYGDDCEHVEVYAVVGAHDELDWSLEGGVLRINPDCTGLFCGAGDVIVTVPYDVEVDVSTGAGDVTVADILAPVWVDAGAGDVEIDRVGSHSLQADTGSGDIDAHHIDVEDAMFDTGAGNVDALFTSPPRELLVDTGAGDVDIAVPRGGYRIEIDTGAGDVDIDDLSHDSSSPNRIHIDTGAGNVDLRGF